MVEWMSYIRSGNPNSSSVSASCVRCCSRCCRCARARVEAGSLLFFPVFLPTSLRSSSSSRTHSSTVVDMGKGPVFYSEIGKKARGWLLLYFSPFSSPFAFFLLLLLLLWLILCLSVFVLVVPFPFHVSLHVHRPVSPLFRLKSRKVEPSTDIVIFIQVRKEKTKRITTLPFPGWEIWSHDVFKSGNGKKRDRSLLVCLLDFGVLFVSKAVICWWQHPTSV